MFILQFFFFLPDSTQTAKRGKKILEVKVNWRCFRVILTYDKQNSFPTESFLQSKLSALAEKSKTILLSFDWYRLKNFFVNSYWVINLKPFSTLPPWGWIMKTGYCLFCEAWPMKCKSLLLNWVEQNWQKANTRIVMREKG